MVKYLSGNGEERNVLITSVEQRKNVQIIPNSDYNYIDCFPQAVAWMLSEFSNSSLSPSATGILNKIHKTLLNYSDKSEIIKKNIESYSSKKELFAYLIENFPPEDETKTIDDLLAKLDAAMLEHSKAQK